MTEDLVIAVRRLLAAWARLPGREAWREAGEAVRELRRLVARWDTQERSGAR